VTLWQRVNARLGARRVLRLMRFYPPLLGAGIRVKDVAEDLRSLEVELEQTVWNRNYMGTAFGGSLYAMCDPFYMFLVIQAMGPGFTVWDKSATIDFIKPGRGRVTARFELTDERLEQIRADLAANGKSHPRFEVIVRDQEGNVVARVGKVLSVRPKRQ
jgi:acyl-coenzyme A thioesterase PaaI-like protein